MIRGLDGIYIRAEHDGVIKSLCLSDCSEADRLRWLNGLDHDGLVSTANHLAKKIREIGEQFDLSSQQQVDDFIKRRDGE